MILPQDLVNNSILGLHLGRGMVSSVRMVSLVRIVGAWSMEVMLWQRIEYYCERSELSGLFNGTDFLIASEASFLVCSMARIFCIIFIISGRTSCRKCSKCFYVYLNIRPMRYSARIESVGNARRQQLGTARQLRTAQSPKERDARLQQLRTAREQTIATESTEERQTRLQQLRSAQQRRIAAETPEEIEARLQQLSTAQQQDCCRIDRWERGPS